MSEWGGLLKHIVTEYGEEDFDAYIDQHPKEEFLYHLSGIRKGLVEWYPFSGNESVLEIGGECGALTEPLSRLCGHVTVVEHNAELTEILRLRLKDRCNLSICDALPSDDEKFDCIMLCGSFVAEIAHNRNLLMDLKLRLKQNGQIWISVENRLGLKYFAGCKEENTGTFFEGVEGFPKGQSKRSFSKKELCMMFDESGFRYQFYYPYPSWVYPMTIYSDWHLPMPGELSNNLLNLDSERYVTFDETKAWNSLIQEGIFTSFANSFLCVLENRD